MSEAVPTPLRQHGSSPIDYHSPQFALEADGDAVLPYLAIDRPGTAQSAALAGKRIAVIGAGPAGLVFARNAAQQGAEVTVFEKAGDPRGEDPGYTNRSFNITLDNVGRQVLGDSRAWQGGIWLAGRAMHDFQHTGQIHYARYGQTADAELISIPRSALRRNLCRLAEEAGATLLFRSLVNEACIITGKIDYQDAHGHPFVYKADLVVFADGLHSMANAMATDAQIEIRPEPRSYVTGVIEGHHNRGLSLQHIHFWHEDSGAYTVGIPNADASISLLLVSLFGDLSEQQRPFATKKEARRRLQAEFPQLYADAPQLAEQLPERYRGHFCYKTVSRYRVGQKGILVGDAAVVFPPWAGYGANKGMYDAAVLVRTLGRHQDIDTALDDFEKSQQQLSNLLIDFVEGQGDFLSGPVAADPDGRSDAAFAATILDAQQRQKAKEGVREGTAGADLLPLAGVSVPEFL